MKKFFRLFMLALCVASLLCVSAMADEPEVPYGTDGEIVWRESPNGKETLEGLKPFSVQSSMYTGFQIGSEVWFIDTGFGIGDPFRITLNEGEKCRAAEIHMLTNTTMVLLGLTSGNDESIAVFEKRSGKRLAETPGVMKAFGGGESVYWIDNYRCLFATSVPGTLRGKNSGNWHGAGVMEMFIENDTDFKELAVHVLAEPTETVQYRAYDVNLDENQCVIMKVTVDSVSEWEKLDEGENLSSLGNMEIINVPVPAAG